jgi:hypothetical protein
MSESRLRLLVLLVLIVFFTTCKSSHDRDRFIASDCAASGKGVKNPHRPVICIDTKGGALRADPDTVEAHNFDRSGAPVKVQWVANSAAGDLNIVWKSEECVEKTTCKGGACTAMVRASAIGKRCKYDVELTGYRTLDPDMIITPCCAP